MAETREYFSKNKLQEAICQFTFKSPLSPDAFSKFAEQVVSTQKYVTIEQQPYFQILFDLKTVNESSNKPQQLTGLKILSQNKDKVIQLFPNNLSIHQIGNYETWEKFNEDISFVLEKFVELYEIEITRIDIRAINNFDFITLENIKNYLTLHLELPSNFNSTTAFNFSIEKVIDENKTFNTIRANYNKNTKTFILDLNYVCFTINPSLKSTDKEEISRILKQGDESLYNIFISSITDETKQHLK